MLPWRPESGERAMGRVFRSSTHPTKLSHHHPCRGAERCGLPAREDRAAGDSAAPASPLLPRVALDAIGARLLWLDWRSLRIGRMRCTRRERPCPTCRCRRPPAYLPRIVLPPLRCRLRAAVLSRGPPPRQSAHPDRGPSRQTSWRGWDPVECPSWCAKSRISHPPDQADQRNAATGTATNMVHAFPT